MSNRRPGGGRSSTCWGLVHQAAGSLYTRPRSSTFSEVTSSSSFFLSAPASRSDEEGSFTSRFNFKMNRAATLAEWRQLGAAQRTALLS